MGKSWDSSGIAYSVELWSECMRVLKPGGHLLAFGGSRTWHRLAVAIEDAGFEMRDSIAWLYGSGFPKSMDVSKAIDKAAGAERKKRISQPTQERTEKGELLKNQRCQECGKATFSSNPCICPRPDKIAVTSEAIKWQGWGTALKPAFEPVVVARKPFKGTVASNVLEWGVGGLNIDGSRIGTDSIQINNYPAGFDPKGNLNGLSQVGQEYETKTSQGRWPANIILDPYTAEILDEQQEEVSRFFYVAKASKRDRNEGLEELEARRASALGYEKGLGNAGEGMFKDRNPQKQNFHPTVKPTSLMRYLIKLVTPPNGTVLDPFTGSGSTGKAAILEGFNFVGIELTEDYLPIIKGRLEHAEATRNADATEQEQKETLF